MFGHAPHLHTRRYKSHTGLCTHILCALQNAHYHPLEGQDKKIHFKRNPFLLQSKALSDDPLFKPLTFPSSSFSWPSFPSSLIFSHPVFLALQWDLYACESKKLQICKMPADALRVQGLRASPTEVAHLSQSLAHSHSPHPARPFLPSG